MYVQVAPGTVAATSHTTDAFCSQQSNTRIIMVDNIDIDINITKTVIPTKILRPTTDYRR
jgi:hypothetical protein